MVLLFNQNPCNQDLAYTTTTITHLLDTQFSKTTGWRGKLRSLLLATRLFLYQTTPNSNLFPFKELRMRTNTTEDSQAKLTAFMQALNTAIADREKYANHPNRLSTYNAIIAIVSNCIRIRMELLIQQDANDPIAALYFNPVRANDQPYDRQHFNPL